jgi:arginine exporter protein ArgO
MNGPEDSSTAVSQAAKTLERMTDLTPSPDEANYVQSYKGLRKAIGIIGIALPIALLVGNPLVDGGGMLGSISAYYYSGMRNYFVGTMCALAVFFFSYKYARRDNLLSTPALAAGWSRPASPPPPGR